MPAEIDDQRSVNSVEAPPADPSAIPISLDPREQRMKGTTRDFGRGPMDFDVPYITQIQGNLWQGGCTSGLVLPDFIEHVVSLYPWEQYVMRKSPKSASFHWMYDDGTQEPPAIYEYIAHWARVCMRDGPTLIHCQAGLNRSSLVTALVLMQVGFGRSAGEVISLLRALRSPAVLCNPAFENWLRAKDA